MFRRSQADRLRRRVPGLLLGLCSGFLIACGGKSAGEVEAGPVEPGLAGRTAHAASTVEVELSDGSNLGEGFLVWESNRTGKWRIWTRGLSVPAARQLSPDQGASPHCCPHISPDGAWVAYLRLDGVGGYAAGGATGELRLIRPDGTDDHAVGGRARALHENRGVVWRDPNELIYLREDFSTWSLDIRDGRTEELLAASSGFDTPERGWLLNPQLTHAVTGHADFSPYDSSSRTVARRNPLGGCQPYFSHDGRWGFWTAGTGGPIFRIDLATAERSTILRKADPRVPRSLGYAYFPMFSKDGRLFTFAGSPYVHDHFKADYEVFVAEADPETLELQGNAVRMTFDPGTDRFPDVFLAPLDLGRHRGEAPFEVRFALATDPSASKATWTFDFGDGSTGAGTTISHTYRKPGRYEVRAVPVNGSDSEARRGRVAVDAAAGPKPVSVSLTDRGRTVVVGFDEAITATEPEIEFGSGRRVTGWSLGVDGRSLLITPETRVDQFETITLGRVGDHAQRVNWMDRASLEIEPPLWPSNRDGLVFLWETGRAPNLVADPSSGAEQACVVHAKGGARLDHDFAMALGAGSFVAEQSDADRILKACTTTNACGVEVVIRPEASTGDGLREIVSFSNGKPHGANFVLGQRGARLIFRPRLSGGGPGALPDVDLGTIPVGETAHVVVSYETGRLIAFVNGVEVADEAPPGGFFHWPRRSLILGNVPSGGTAWIGALEGLAIYDRFIERAEAIENHLRYRETLAQRPEVPRLVVEATLLTSSPAPSLQEISPYREALAVSEYRIDRVIEGQIPGERIRVAHWVILDGATLEADTFGVGSQRTLTLEPYADNPQLESTFVADSLPPGSAPLFYAVSD